MSSPQEILASLPNTNFGARNLLINSAGFVQQRSVTTIASGNYGQVDQWYAESAANPIQFSNVADVADGIPSMVRVTQSNASAQRMGAVQPLESYRCKYLRGQSVTLSGKVRQSSIAGSTTVRYAILGWTGTADALTRELVANWASTTFTTGNFFASTSLLLYGMGSFVLAAANTVYDLTPLTVSLGSTFNNLFVIIWTDAAVAQNVTLDFRAQLEAGQVATPYEFRPIQQDIMECQRYYEIGYYDALGSSGGYVGSRVYFKTTKRSVPGITTSGQGAGNMSLPVTIDSGGLDGFRIYGVAVGNPANFDGNFQANSAL